MAVNIYDQPAQAQFMNTYVPIPFQEMLAAGQAKQNRYDKAGNAMDSAIASAEDITAVPYSDDERRAKEYIANLRSVRDKYVGKDISDPFVQREMVNEMNKAVDREDIKHIQQTYQGYTAYNKMLSENEQRGVPTPPELRQRFEGYDSRKGVFTGTAPVYLDPMQETSQFFKDIRPDTIATQYEKINGKETGRLYDLVGVTENKLLKHAQQNMGAFLALPAVRQMVSVARSRGDQRPPEEIAIDYVKSNAKKWAYQGKDNVAFDPNWKRSGGSDRTPGRETEVITPYGVNAKEAKPLKPRKVAAKLEEWQTLADAGNKEYENKIQQANQVFKQVEETHAPAKQAIVERGQTAFDAAFNALKQTGMSSDEAFNYLVSNSDADVIGRTAGVEAALQRGETFKKNAAKAALKTSDFLLENSLLGAFVSADSKKQFSEYVDRMSSDTIKTKGEILKEYTRQASGVVKDLNRWEDKVDEEKVTEFNKTLPSQGTYTELNDMFRFDNGMIRGTYTDQNGTEKKYESNIGKRVGNVLYNMKDHQTSFFDMKGKELSQKKQNNLNTILQKSNGFIITGLDNELSPNNGALVTVHMLNDKSIPTGEKFKVDLSLNQGEDLNNIVQELGSRGQDRTAFAIYNLPNIKNEVSKTDVYGGGSIPLNNIGIENGEEGDAITFQRQGAKIVPLITFKGQTKPMSGPVIYENLGNAINAYLQRIQEQGMNTAETQ